VPVGNNNIIICSPNEDFQRSPGEFSGVFFSDGGIPKEKRDAYKKGAVKRAEKIAKPIG
jgi:hypothetical protein